uniref:Putative secreted protein n=1 Tax=Ixodes ricinus TaxID=34613 RepID=A0A6B0V0I8_IXORI
MVGVSGGRRGGMFLLVTGSLPAAVAGFASRYVALESTVGRRHLLNINSRFPFVENRQSRHANPCCRPSIRAHSQSPPPGLQIALPTPALRRLAVQGYQCPSLAAEPPRDRHSPGHMAKGSPFPPVLLQTSLVDCSEVRHGPGQAARLRRSWYQLQPCSARTLSRQLVSSLPTACHVPSASSCTLGSHSIRPQSP